MKIQFVFLSLSLLFAFPQANAAVVGYYRFENNLLDSSGNNLNATAPGGDFSYTSNIPGSIIEPGNLSNTAAYNRQGGDGTTTTVAENATFSSLFAGDSWTVEAFVWLNSTGQSGSLGVFSNRADSLGIGFSLARDDGPGYTARISYTNGNDISTGTNFPLSGGGLPAEEWVHVAWTGAYTPDNGTALRFYVNGTQVGGTGFSADSDGTAIQMSSADWSIGHVGNPFNGVIDELRISSGVLPPSEFLQAIPEPSAIMGLLAGCGLVALRQLRRRNS